MSDTSPAKGAQAESRLRVVDLASSGRTDISLSKPEPFECSDCHQRLDWVPTFAPPEFAPWRPASHKCPAREREERQSQARQDFWEYGRRYSLVQEIYKNELLAVKEFRGADFGSWTWDYEYNPGCNQGREIAMAYALNFEARSTRGRGLLFIGGNGLGKTGLCVAIARYLLAKQRVVVVERASKLLRRLGETYRNRLGPTCTEMLERLGLADLAILDDLGIDGVSERLLIDLFDALADVPIIATTNVGAGGGNIEQALVAVMGKRVADKLKPRCLGVYMSGQSYRDRLAAEMAAAEIKEMQKGVGGDG